MAIDPNKNSVFSVQGARFRRLNYDGTQPLITRQVGGAGPFDLSGLVATSGQLTSKIDAGAEDSNAVDFAAALDQSAVTVDEVVTAFGLIGFTNLTVSKEVATGYLMFALTVVAAEFELQLYGELAGYLGIGRSNSEIRIGDQLGTKWLKGFDDTLSVAETKNLKDKEEVETESGDGSITTVIIDSILKGETPVVTTDTNNLELKALIMDGIYNETEESFVAPGTANTVKPSLRMETYAPEYAAGTNKKADKVRMLQKIYYSCTGMEGDVTKEAKAFANFPYNMDATEWTDAAGDKQTSFKETKLQLAEWAALDVENV